MCSAACLPQKVTLRYQRRFASLTQSVGNSSGSGSSFFAPRYGFLAKSCDLEISEGNFSQRSLSCYFSLLVLKRFAALLRARALRCSCGLAVAVKCWCVQSEGFHRLFLIQKDLLPV